MTAALLLQNAPSKYFIRSHYFVLIFLELMLNSSPYSTLCILEMNLYFSLPVLSLCCSVSTQDETEQNTLINPPLSGRAIWRGLSVPRKQFSGLVNIRPTWLCLVLVADMYSFESFTLVKIEKKNRSRSNPKFEALFLTALSI